MVKDIELRFVERFEQIDAHCARMVKVLQQRKLIERREHGYGNGGIWDEWTEWADVPLVKEG